MGNPFLDYFKYWAKSSKEIWISNYIALYKKKTAFKTDFGHREVPKQENLHFHFNALVTLVIVVLTLQTFRTIKQN